MLDKNLKRIYRLEYSDSRGMYCKLGTRGWKGAGHKVIKQRSQQHPSPFGDMKLMTGLVEHGKLLEDCFFCFSSIKALRAWVDEDKWIVGLHNLGVKLAVYTCEKSCIIEGEKQALFYSSVRRRQYDLRKYFKI